MITQINHSKPIDRLFYASYGIILVFDMLSSSFYYNYFFGALAYVRLFTIALLVVRELLVFNFDQKSIVVGIIFAVFAVVTKLQSGSITAASILIYLFCGRSIKFEDVAVFSLYICSFTLAFIVVSSYVGIIPNHLSIGNGRTRFFLGFRYALFGPAYLFNITALSLYLHRNNEKWYRLLLLLLINLWFYLQTDSRLSFGLSIMLLAVFAVLKIYPSFFENKKILYLILVFSFVICFVVCVFFAAIYDGQVAWQSQIDRILGGRLRLAHNSLTTNGVSLFPRDIEFVGAGLDINGNRAEGTYNYVDCLYVQMLQQFGVVFSLVWMILLTFSQYIFYKKKKYALLICMSFFAFRFVVDDLSFRLHYNTFYLALTVIFDKYTFRACNQGIEEKNIEETIP